MPKITVTGGITKITSQGSDNGKYNKLMKQSRERGFRNVTKIPKITTIPKITKITIKGAIQVEPVQNQRSRQHPRVVVKETRRRFSWSGI